MSRAPIDLEERMAITDLLAAYCHAMDAARADLAIRLFADDAVLETPVGNATGRAAILAWIEGRLALRSSAHQVGHYLLNPLFARTSEARIRVRSMLLYTRQSLEENGRSELLSTGIYEDVVERSSAGWRFARRCWQLRTPLEDGYFSAFS
ncbi:MAG: nuclear transport factor 2 family protein [Myxococcota bacterium]